MHLLYSNWAPQTTQDSDMIDPQWDVNANTSHMRSNWRLMMETKCLLYRFLFFSFFSSFRLLQSGWN